ncbi:hypothetical protein TNCV_3581841 [Trichonephila clavipes]|nr:hypothetical protein TNCV_3581841 [Trichonephila clavipes]
MEVTRVEQRAYIKIAVLRGRNVMYCHSELVEALGNNALPYHTVAREWTARQRHEDMQQSVIHIEDEDKETKRARTLDVTGKWNAKRSSIPYRDCC